MKLGRVLALVAALSLTSVIADSCTAANARPVDAELTFMAFWKTIEVSWLAIALIVKRSLHWARDSDLVCTSAEECLSQKGSPFCCNKLTYDFRLADGTTGNFKTGAYTLADGRTGNLYLGPYPTPTGTADAAAASVTATATTLLSPASPSSTVALLSSPTSPSPTSNASAPSLSTTSTSPTASPTTVTTASASVSKTATASTVRDSWVLAMLLVGTSIMITLLLM